MTINDLLMLSIEQIVKTMRRLWLMYKIDSIKFDLDYIEKMREKGYTEESEKIVERMNLQCELRDLDSEK